MITEKHEVTPERLAQEMQAIAERLKLPAAVDAYRFPKYFQIETTRVCNARCPFCAVDKWDKSVPFMSDELFSKIVQELGEYADWVEFVAVQRAGEPLLDKKIVERVRMLKEAGIRRVSMSTNASMLTEEKGMALLESGLDELMMSIDSVHRESYMKMRVGLDYDQVIQNIRTFFLLRDRYRPSTVIRVRGVSFFDPDRPGDAAAIAEWEAFWGGLRGEQDRIYLKRAHNWGNQKQWEGHTPEFGDVFHPCILPWSTMHITSMGIVPLCPQDYDAEMAIGNVNRNTISEIWRNERWTEIRNQHQSGRRNEIPFCRGCRLFDPELSLEKHGQKRLYEG